MLQAPANEQYAASCDLSRVPYALHFEFRNCGGQSFDSSLMLLVRIANQKIEYEVCSLSYLLAETAAISANCQRATAQHHQDMSHRIGHSLSLSAPISLRHNESERLRFRSAGPSRPTRHTPLSAQQGSSPPVFVRRRGGFASR